MHGGVGEDGAEPSSNAAASATAPTTPHIIVSAEEDEVADNATPKVRLTYDNNEVNNNLYCMNTARREVEW